MDTSVVSQSYKSLPNPRWSAWLAKAPPSRLRISAITLYELRVGAELLPSGAKRTAIERWIEVEVKTAFAQRTIQIGASIADRAARITAEARKSGINPELADVLIAATASVLDFQIATLNRKHFQPLGVTLVDF